jgi:hypothetical protein
MKTQLVSNPTRSTTDKTCVLQHSAVMIAELFEHTPTVSVASSSIDAIAFRTMRSIAMFLSCLSPDDDVGPDAGEESGEEGEGGGGCEEGDAGVVGVVVVVD